MTVGAVANGLARLFSTLSIVESRPEPADQAVRISPADPEAHYTKGLELVNAERLPEAIIELKRATELRPHHYYEWLDLGVTLDRTGDTSAAELALRESIRLAPFFGQPRWQLGNLLYREARYDEAFSELRLATNSNPNLADTLLTLAWAVSDGDVNTFQSFVRPETARRQFEAGYFLAKQKQGAAAAAAFRQAGQAETARDQVLLHEGILQLLAGRDFSSAFAIWELSHRRQSDEKDQIFNGNFVEPVVQNDPGFGWQLPVLANVGASVDTSGPASAANSLRLEFKGEVDPNALLLNQLVLVQPRTHYTLKLMARSDKVVTGGPVALSITDVTAERSQILAGPKTLPVGTAPWTEYDVDFDTADRTSVMSLDVRRLPCSQLPCPIFGRLWLGGFNLTKK